MMNNKTVPTLYTQGDRGSHATMVAHHVGKTLTENMRKRWMDLLFETADEIGLANDPEFRSAMISYTEWGSRLPSSILTPAKTLLAQQNLCPSGAGVR